MSGVDPGGLAGSQIVSEVPLGGDGGAGGEGADTSSMMVKKLDVTGDVLSDLVLHCHYVTRP